jgi:membrane-associated phospholipid phosphatase
MSTPVTTQPERLRPVPRHARAGRTWLWCSLPAALGLGFLLDGTVAHWARTEGLRAWFEAAFFPVTDRLALVANLLAIGLGFPRRWRPSRNTLYHAVGFAVAFFAHLPLVHLLKWLVGRARPLANLGAFHFEPCSAAKYADSFPSAHTSAAVMLALLLALHFPRYGWVFYVWAGLEGLKRIILEWHFLSDVLAGWLLAWLIVFTFVRYAGPPWFPQSAYFNTRPTHTTSSRPFT